MIYFGESSIFISASGFSLIILLPVLSPLSRVAFHHLHLFEGEKSYVVKANVIMLLSSMMCVVVCVYGDAGTYSYRCNFRNVIVHNIHAREMQRVLVSPACYSFSGIIIMCGIYNHV